MHNCLITNCGKKGTAKLRYRLIGKPFDRPENLAFEFAFKGDYVFVFCDAHAKTLRTMVNTAAVDESDLLNKKGLPPIQVRVYPRLEIDEESFNDLPKTLGLNPL